MADREKVLKGLECLARTKEPTSNPCKDCGYIDRPNFAMCVVDVAIDALELLKEQQETIDELNTAIATKHSLLFSPYEVGLAMAANGRKDPQFKWGETIRYAPSEVAKILKGESLIDVEALIGMLHKHAFPEPPEVEQE